MNNHEHTAAIVPCYNNAGTVADVVAGVRRHVGTVIVVDDGSTDGTAQVLACIEGIEVISYARNRGKGYALRKGFRLARERGFRYALTIDADGQHFADDIPMFLRQAVRTPDALVIGARNLAQENMPQKNSFANRFSNFWFYVETGRRMSDTQSGFRLYPLRKMRNMRFIARRYEFELESAVRLAWKRGMVVVNIPIGVYYAPREQRVSHFRPVRDFMRISLMNSALVIVAGVYYYPVWFVRWLSWLNLKLFFRRHVTRSQDSNARLAAAIGLGVFWGIGPVWGAQMVLAGITAHLMRLNKVIAIAVSNISIPPMIPLILYASFATGGMMLDMPVPMMHEVTLEHAAESMVQYVVGSTVLSLISGGAAWLLSYVLLKIFRKEPDGNSR